MLQLSSQAVETAALETAENHDTDGGCDDDDVMV